MVVENRRDARTHGRVRHQPQRVNVHEIEGQPLRERREVGGQRGLFQPVEIVRGAPPEAPRRHPRPPYPRPVEGVRKDAHGSANVRQQPDRLRDGLGRSEQCALVQGDEVDFVRAGRLPQQVMAALQRAAARRVRDEVG